jgi:hypothetical protein
MLGRQSLDEVFKNMCSSRNFIEKLERTIGRKPDYAALRKLQDDPGFNELSDHVFSMLTPLADSEETALCCILRMRESELRVLQQLHSKLHNGDSSKCILESDISSRRKIVDILKYALKLNQQENVNGVPLAVENPSDELDTDAANMCQRIVQRRLNFLELIADGSIDSAQQHNVPCETKHSSINQRLAETAKNVERSLNSLGSHSDLSMHDLDCSSFCAINPPHLSDRTNFESEPSNETTDLVMPVSPLACHSIIECSVSAVDTNQGDRFDLKYSDVDDEFPRLPGMRTSSVHQSTTLIQKFEVMTAIPRRLSPSVPLSTSHICTTITGKVPCDSEQKLNGKMLRLSDANQTVFKNMKQIAPFAMVKQSKTDLVPAASKLSTPATTSDDSVVITNVPTKNSHKYNIPPLRKYDIQPSPHKNFSCTSPTTIEAEKADDLESYCQSKATVLKIRKSSIGSFAKSKGADSHSPIRYIYADLVHSSQSSPSGGNGGCASPVDIVVTRPCIAHVSGLETVRSPRKYEAQMNRLRSSSVGRSPHASDAPLFRESHFPVMKKGSHLELRSPNERFEAAVALVKHPLGWV